jgi:hypothetical protein
MNTIQSHRWMLGDVGLASLPSVFEGAVFTFDHPEMQQVMCPVCGGGYQWTRPPQHLTSNDDTGWGGHGDLIVIPMRGECQHQWDICLGFHKGNTFAFVRVPQQQAA